MNEPLLWFLQFLSKMFIPHVTLPIKMSKTFALKYLCELCLQFFGWTQFQTFHYPNNSLVERNFLIKWCNIIPWHHLLLFHSRLLESYTQEQYFEIVPFIFLQRSYNSHPEQWNSLFSSFSNSFETIMKSCQLVTELLIQTQTLHLKKEKNDDKNQTEKKMNLLKMKHLWKQILLKL